MFFGCLFIDLKKTFALPIKVFYELSAFVLKFPLFAATNFVFSLNISFEKFFNVLFQNVAAILSENPPKFLK